MALTINVYESVDVDAIEDVLLRLEVKVDRLTRLVEQTNIKENFIMADLTALTQAVTDNSSVVDSAVLLINDIAAQLSAAATDPAAVQAIADQLTAKSAELAAAVAANTPAAPPIG